MEDGTIKLVPNEDLPVILPKLKDYKSRNGKAPLEFAEDWKNVVIDGKKEQEKLLQCQDQLGHHGIS